MVRLIVTMVLVAMMLTTSATLGQDYSLAQEDGAGLGPVSQREALELVLATDARYSDLSSWQDLWEAARDDFGQQFLENSYYRVHSAHMNGMTPFEFAWTAPRVAPSWLIEVTLVRDCAEWELPSDAPELSDEVEPFIDDPCGWRHSWFYRVRPSGAVDLLFDEGDPDT